MNTTTDDFRIKDLAKDKDALLLIGLSIVMVLLILAGLAFLTENQWNRLVERGHILWAVGLAAVPTVVAIWSRYNLRGKSAEALGVAAQPPVIEERLVATLATGLSNPPAEPPDLIAKALPIDILADDEELIDYSGGKT